jgi:hypothetical protein
LALPPDFNILGRENLALACTKCNTDKSDTILTDGRLTIYLSKIRDRLPRLESELERRKAEQSLDGILRAIARGVERRSFTRAELIRRLRDENAIGFISNAVADQELIEVHVPDLGNESPRGRLRISRQAAEGMEKRAVTPANLVDMLMSGVLRVMEQASRRPKRKYAVTTENGMEIVYGLAGSSLTIESIAFG